MPSEIHYLKALLGALRARLADSSRRSDGGYTTETVVITALLVGLGIAAMAIIAAKVRAKANGLKM